MGVGVAVEYSIAQEGMGSWRFAAASVRGVGHERMEMPCQDACRVQLLRDETLLITVADGAGSARLSEFGSIAAVEAVVDYFAAGDTPFSPPVTDADWQALLTSLLQHAREAVERERKPGRPRCMSWPPRY